MKTNLKYQNGNLPQNAKHKYKRFSLSWCALAVLGTFLICSLVLTPISDALKEEYNLGKTDVAINGTLGHTMLSAGAEVFFYLSSMLSTVGLFLGASYIVNFAVTKRKKNALISATITLAGLNCGAILSLLAFLILKISSPRLTLAASAVEDMLINGLFYLVCILIITALTFLLARKKTPLYIYAMTCSLVMYVCAAGLELFDNVPFFLNGTILQEDVKKMIISMILYMIHALIGFLIMMRMTKRPKAKVK